MKKVKNKTNYFFVDESGDPTFYDRHGNLIIDKQGVSPILILGFIKTNNPKEIRSKLEKIRRDISEDSYLKGIPSIKKSLISFHAKDDCPEVRERVFKLIVKLDFHAEIVVARKIQNIFNETHHRNENEFYDDLIVKLFESKFDKLSKNIIYFAVRGSRSRQDPIEKAINERDCTIEVQPQKPSGEPCLQIIDYVNWAIQRAYVKKEDRFFKYIKNKIKCVFDVYDEDKYPKNYYDAKNLFSIKKISPL